MKKIKSHFKFNRQERSGIFFLLLLIVVFQLVYFFLKVDVPITSNQSFVIDSETQRQIDALKKKQLLRDTLRLYPFNPNFISDYKGYTLGMSPEEIDRLLDFRAQDRFVNSAEEFQEVTLISDSLIKAISPYFKFPDWTQKRSRQVSASSSLEKTKTTISNTNYAYKDINTATAEELKTIRGIGDKLSARIIKFRNGLGGFLIKEQLYDVYGLNAEVVERTFEKFQVLKRPNIHKINLNTASAMELSRLVYLTTVVASRIVEYRESVDGISSFNELTRIEGFPADKIDRIRLYLTL